MNATGTPPRTTSPTLPIQKISRLAWMLCAVVFVLNLVFRWQSLLRQFEFENLDRVNCFNQIEELVWSLFWCGFFGRLFRLFEKGQIFTKTSVGSLRVLGFVCIAKFLVDLVWTWMVMSNHNPAPGWVPWWSLLNDLIYRPTALFSGLATLLIAYLLDQARLLKEEQALTI